MIMSAESPDMDSSYTVQEAEKDFGPCGKILYALQQVSDPVDMDVNLLFGLEACWSQHRSMCRLSPEQMQHVELLAPVFRVNPDLMPPHARQARTKAFEVDWVKKIHDLNL